MSVIASLLAAALAASPVPVKAAATYEPSGPPNALVVFLSGDGGWNLGVIGMAQRLASEGAAVAALDTPKLLAALDSSAPEGCADLAGTIEAFAKDERAALHVPDAAPLILAGYSSGATAIYIAEAAMAKGAVRGAVALGFCPDMENKRPICASGGHADLTAEKIKTGYLFSTPKP